MGLPDVYTETIADEILRRIANGESLRRICLDSHIPSLVTIRKWVLENRDGFAPRYKEARDMQADYYQELILEEAWREDINPNLARLRVDALKWTASKLKPGSYGDKVSHEVTGADGGPVAFVLRDMTKGE